MVYGLYDTISNIYHTRCGLLLDSTSPTLHGGIDFFINNRIEMFYLV